MPPRATAALSFYEFVWYQGCAFRVPTQIFPPMTLLLKAFISSLWQKIDYYPWHLMDSFHKRTFFFFYFMLAYKVPLPPPPKKNFPKTRKEFLSSLVNPPLGVCSWDQEPKKKHWRASTDLSLLLGLPCFWPGKVRKCRKDSPLEPLDKTVRLIQSTVSYFITMKHSTYAWKGESLWEKYFYNSCLHSEKGIVCCVGWKRSPPPAGV